MENQHLIPVSRRNRELGRQLQGTLRKTNKKRANKYIHRHTSMHVGMYDCMRVRARVCVRWHWFANLSTVSVCLPVHTVTQNTHIHTSIIKNTGKHMSRNDSKSTLALKPTVSVLSHEKQSRATHTLTQAMKARKKCRVAGLTNGCCTNKASCEEKQKV
jgi:hypothetical protein